jgi:hypothetical protein
MLGHAKMGEASLLVGKVHMKNALRNMNKSLPNHLLSLQIMKKKNTGIKEVAQGHRAKQEVRRGSSSPIFRGP